MQLKFRFTSAAILPNIKQLWREIILHDIDDIDTQLATCLSINKTIFSDINHMRFMILDLENVFIHTWEGVLNGEFLLVPYNCQIIL